MRVAVLSDIHGNSIALDAVLEDIEDRGGVDEYWLLGDYVAIGPDPVGVIRRLLALPNATLVLIAFLRECPGTCEKLKTN